MPAERQATAASVVAALKAIGDPDDAHFLQRYFKTGPGEYGAGDRFLGIRVPVIRQQARSHRNLGLAQTERLLHSPWHEARLLALLILIERNRRADATLRKAIVKIYLTNTRYINNWDLVDLSAPHIVGSHCESDTTLLERLAGAELIWERRIAIIATFHHLRLGQIDPSLRLAGQLVADEHDLIHKAVGWVLREVGKLDRAAEERFLKRHYRAMPRTMLRYAIEKFPEGLRQRYLKGMALS